MFPWVALGVLAALPAPAQEKPPVKEEPRPAAVELPVTSCAGSCEHSCGGIKVLWAEHEVPIQRLEPREVIRTIKRPTFVVAYREEKRTVHDTVVKTRDVERLVPCTTMQPCTVTDPCTGHCTTVLKSVTEMKLVKDVECYSVPVTREVTVKVPYLKAAEEEVKQKMILVDTITVMKKEGCPVVIPSAPVPKERWFLAQPPCAPCEH
jgi:hypothetical protein